MMNSIQSTHVLLPEKEDWEEKEDVGGGGWGSSSGGGGGGSSCIHATFVITEHRL